ncbi:MAG: carbon monoxide dehydrogenase, partial [Desulfovibrio sp.]|nr:carbon monoxide dehydrogenase [Desulfovibrio sp.]
LIPDVAAAKLELTETGRLRLYCGVVEMGQGNSGTFADLAASILGQDPASVEIVLPDTARTLACGSASASRTTYTFANALLPAAQQLKKNILAAVARHWGLGDGAGLALAPGLARHGERELPLAQAAALMPLEERTVVRDYQAPVSAQRLTEDKMVTMLGLPHRVFSFAAHLARVEVDEITGGVEVKDYLAATDCGRLLNRAMAEQQVRGAVAQGLGYALMEEMPSQAGRILTPDLSTYLIPTALDLPEVESIFVDSLEPTGPHGMKGVGEVGIDPPLPAVGNAVAGACQARPTAFPLTPERVKALLGGGA